jgi:hypothetical protein
MAAARAAAIVKILAVELARLFLAAQQPEQQSTDGQ